MTPFGNMEGGLPHYRYGAIFDGRETKLFEKPLEAIEALPNGVWIFRANFEVFANGQKVKGWGSTAMKEESSLLGEILKLEKLLRSRSFEMLTFFPP